MGERPVKLGRKFLAGSLALHWAVQVGDNLWYEIGAPNNHDYLHGQAYIQKGGGGLSTSGAGQLGGEYVGKTKRQDGEIEEFNTRWIEENPTYNLFTTNCQKYAIEFIRWLTEDRYFLRHEPNAAVLKEENSCHVVRFCHDGQAFIDAHAFEAQGILGPLIGHLKILSADAQAACGVHGVGAWANVSLFRVEVTVGLVAAHIDLNIDTGIGILGGNLDVHVLGFGFRVGADGLSIDSPFGGLSTTCLFCCCLGGF